MSAYEREKQANIARNKKLLEGLNFPGAIESLGFPTTTKDNRSARSTKVATKKRKSTLNQDEMPEGRPAKISRTREVSTLGTRRSQRNVGKTVDYTAEIDLRVASRARSNVKGEDGPLGRESGKRIHNPSVHSLSQFILPFLFLDRKTYGSIPGISVGTLWESRCKTKF